MKAIVRFTGHDYAEESINLPVEALYDDLAEGHCWEFSGGQGQLGIVLSHRADVKGLMVAHGPPSASSKAPKDIVLWRLMDLGDGVGSENTQRPAKDFVIAGKKWPFASNAVFKELGKYRFDGTLGSVQSFSVEGPSRMNVSVVLFEVKSNWGGDSTCIYNVGIFD